MPPRTDWFVTVLVAIALLTVAGCVPIEESGHALLIPTATPEPVPTATPEPPPQNVAPLGYSSSSQRTESAHLLIDGDSDTIWNARLLPPQWFSIALNQLYLVDRVELEVTQLPAGPTTHEIWLGNGSGTRTLYKRFRDLHTQDGQLLAVDIDPPRLVDEVLVRTLHGPSWVAWREAKVFGEAPSPADAAAAEPVLKLREMLSGLELPVQVTHAGDGTSRVFVVEQRGRIRIIENGVLLETPFLDISHRVDCCGEKGLLNVAFPPSYPTSQQFYVSYSDATDSSTVISRFSTTSSPSKADPDSEEILLTLEQLDFAHNGGRLVFGPNDGYLYVGSGDGGGGNDPRNRGQSTRTLLGKILRIDVESDAEPYRIPEDNPFAQAASHRAEIWAFGLRNPWGFAFDPQNGDLYIPDVGSSRLEEVNYQPASSSGGENYGWRTNEGTACFPLWYWPCTAEGLTSPVAEYGHFDGCAVVGGHVYRGDSLSLQQGAFIFADFCRGRIWGLMRSDQDLPEGWESKLLVSSSAPLSSIGEDEEGNVYAASYNEGVIYLLTDGP